MEGAVGACIWHHVVQLLTKRACMGLCCPGEQHTLAAEVEGGLAFTVLYDRSIPAHN